MVMDKISFNKLQKFNFVMGFVHLAQGVLILLISKSYSLPVTGSYLELNQVTGSLYPKYQDLFKINLPLLIAGFFFISALAHLIIATVKNSEYNKNLKLGINKYRWFEYSVSASIMMLAIAMLVGIYDLLTLLAIFGFVAIMNLLGYLMEVHNQTTSSTNWLSYLLGCLAGIIPWMMVVFQFWLGAINDSKPPVFVYWIFLSIFIFFN